MIERGRYRSRRLPRRPPAGCAGPWPPAAAIVSTGSGRVSHYHVSITLPLRRDLG